jgi:pyruvate dehydrogenase E2 component (dihydrolipoamide acetyltransferase)
MAVEVFIPKMTDHMEAGLIVKWLVQEGDQVERGQPLLELETDKAIAELESPASGILTGIRPGLEPGTSVPVGETIAFIARAGEALGQAQAGAPAAIAASEREAAAQAAVTSRSHAIPSRPEGVEAEPGRIRAAPVVRRIASELGVDLALVPGSGPGGRILEKDVRYFLEAREAGAQAGEQRRRAVGAPAEADAALAGAADAFDWQELTAAQRLTAKRMTASTQSAPQFSLSASADMTRVLELRSAVEQQAGGRPSVTAFIVKLVAGVLKDHPRVNASFDNGRLRLHKQVNIGVAVGADEGLVVPVIHAADRKSPVEIGHELQLAQDKAASRRLDLNDLTGGTFTISNLGMYGIDRFVAIVNPPESAILAVGRIVKQLVVLADDTIGLRPMMALTLTVDHRALDGIAAAKFLSAVREALEQPHPRL